jgi:glycerol-3-phosphate dehydrogenase (NAD(P)+)
MKIGILGGGSWAIALATLLHKRGHKLSVWEFNPRDAEALRVNRELPQKLPGVLLPDSVAIENDIHATVAFGEVIVCAVPAQTMRATIKTLVRSTSQEERDAVKAWVIVAKGIEVTTLKLMSEVLQEELPKLPQARVVALSGPSLAPEVARHVPTSVVAACTDPDLARLVQREFSTETFRIYTNDDIVGVELGGSVKNVIVIAAGISDGLGLGDNSKGALLTRGLVEMVRLGKAMGAREETFFGLAGVGDLISTAISRLSRNRKFGDLIGSGLTTEEALRQMIMVAEGVETAKSVYQLSHKFHLEMPITEQVYLALFEGKPARLALRDLMARESKPERKGAAA